MRAKRISSTTAGIFLLLVFGASYFAGYKHGHRRAWIEAAANAANLVPHDLTDVSPFDGKNSKAKVDQFFTPVNSIPDSLR